MQKENVLQQQLSMCLTTIRTSEFIINSINLLSTLFPQRNYSKKLRELLVKINRNQAQISTIQSKLCVLQETELFSRET